MDKRKSVLLQLKDIGGIWILAVVCSFAMAPHCLGQVGIIYDGDQIVIQNHGHDLQIATRVTGKKDSGWLVGDGVGNGYQAACNASCRQNSDGSWSCGGYTAADGVDRSLLDGYEAALAYLEAEYGAVVMRDEDMEIDQVSFPDSDDPYGLLASVLLNDYVNGRRLVEYFKTIELNTVGVTGDKLQASKPKGRKLSFPNDPYFTSQWNIRESNLLLANIVPVAGRLNRPVRIGILDSGINDTDAAHEGLDGIRRLEHRWTAPATGFSDQHALAVTTLLADAGNDADGPVGLVGRIDMSCRGYEPNFNRYEVDIISYSVGAWGPMTPFVQRAIREATEDDKVDILLLNFRMAYSPSVEDAIKTAIAHGVIVIAAAGNYAGPHKIKPTGFPAYIAGVVSVGSAGRGHEVSKFSARDADVLAPGEDIVVGVAGGWVYGDGTSFAAPHVAAVAVLAKHIDPRLTSFEFEDIVSGAAEHRGRGNSSRRWRSKDSPGFLDAYATLAAVSKKRSSIRLPFINWDGGLQSCDLAKIGTEGVWEQTSVAPLGNYPNPFTTETDISIESDIESMATLTIINVIGQMVDRVDVAIVPGRNRVHYNASSLASGPYSYVIAGEGWRIGGRMVIVK